MNKQPFFDTRHHRCVIAEIGVKLYNKESLEEGETPDVQLEFSYTEALDLARALLAREVEFEARQVELDARFTQLSDVLVSRFEAEERRSREHWQQEIGFVPEGARDFGELLRAAYKSLQEHAGAQVQHWYHEDEEQVVRFWHAFGRFFNERYADDLLERFFPEDEEEATR